MNYEDKELINHCIKLKELRAAQPINTAGQSPTVEVSENSATANNLSPTSSLTTSGQSRKSIKKLSHWITRCSGKAVQKVKKAVSFGSMKGSDKSTPPTPPEMQVSEEVKEKIREKVQEAAKQLRDRLDLDEDVPIPAPLNIRKKTTITPMPSGLDENMGNNIESFGSTAQEVITPAMWLSSSSVAAEPHSGAALRNKPQFHEYGKPQVNSRARPYLTEAGPIHTQQNIVLHSAGTSSLSAPDFIPSINPPAPTNIRTGAQQKSPCAASITHPLDTSRKDLSHLPRHLQSENQRGSRLSQNTSVRLSDATTACEGNYETRGVIETPAVVMEERSTFAEESECSDAMSRPADTAFGPPPFPPPNHPPPLAPTHAQQQRRRRSVRGIPGPAAGIHRVPRVSKRYSGIPVHESTMCVRDFSLPSSPGSLGDPEPDRDARAPEQQRADDKEDGEEDDGPATGGWLVLQRRAHQRAIAACLGDPAARSPAVGRSPASRVEAEMARRVAAVVRGPARDSRPAIAGAGVASGGTSPSSSADVGNGSKPSFLQRCGKAFAKKRSFWKRTTGSDK
ncbi:hypothetical protein SAMD00023353_5500730 [Rosellinia necatrix]|uniref:Uncharacterized protein n=1 Tax=Rosellinia necatrix TaxID=77044 RepID=A0A1W2TQY9_ROSNE|nr:hypothetical protein SAMD00023353_5500730 [Rosellinia necatrix]